MKVFLVFKTVYVAGKPEVSFEGGKIIKDAVKLVACVDTYEKAISILEKQKNEEKALDRIWIETSYVDAPYQSKQFTLKLLDAIKTSKKEIEPGILIKHSFVDRSDHEIFIGFSHSNTMPKSEAEEFLNKYIRLVNEKMGYDALSKLEMSDSVWFTTGKYKISSKEFEKN
jgi:hypothetical protein